MPYCVLMDGLAKARQMHEAKVVFDEMMKKHVRSGKFSFGVFFNETKHHVPRNLHKLLVILKGLFDLK
jgi:pentatricopeptide repeat protein